MDFLAARAYNDLELMAKTSKERGAGNSQNGTLSECNKKPADTTIFMIKKQ